MIMVVIKSIKADNIDAALNGFLTALFDNKAVDELMVPIRTSSGLNYLPTLIHDKSQLQGARHASPVVNASSAVHLVQLTEDKTERKLGALMRPCENRAAVELIKLKQIDTDNLVTLSHICLGTLSLRNYANLIQAGKTNEELLGKLMQDRFSPVEGDIGIRESCKLCTYRVSPTADIQIGFKGPEGGWELLAISQTEKGEELLKNLDLPDGKPPEGMEEMMKKFAEDTENYLKEISPELDAMTASPEDLEKSMDLCIRCYNCMSMCPICYCKECFFQSSPVVPSPTQYQKRAAKKGSLNMPSDKMLFQLGRMNHMITSCIGCGQCLEACPNDVDYLRQFPYMAKIIQKVFDYEAGRDEEDPLPLADFKEDELFPK
jgi:formate dehydrogenase subunit beta